MRLQTHDYIYVNGLPRVLCNLLILKLICEAACILQELRNLGGKCLAVYSMVFRIVTGRCLLISMSTFVDFSPRYSVVGSVGHSKLRTTVLEGFGFASRC